MCWDKGFSSGSIAKFFLVRDVPCPFDIQIIIQKALPNFPRSCQFLFKYIDEHFDYRKSHIKDTIQNSIKTDALHEDDA